MEVRWGIGKSVANSFLWVTEKWPGKCGGLCVPMVASPSATLHNLTSAVSTSTVRSQAQCHCRCQCCVWLTVRVSISTVSGVKSVSVHVKRWRHRHTRSSQHGVASTVRVSEPVSLSVSVCQRLRRHGKRERGQGRGLPFSFTRQPHARCGYHTASAVICAHTHEAGKLSWAVYERHRHDELLTSDVAMTDGLLNKGMGGVSSSETGKSSIVCRISRV